MSGRKIVKWVFVTLACIILFAVLYFKYSYLIPHSYPPLVPLREVTLPAIGTLQAASNDPILQKKAIDKIISERKKLEITQSQGDVTFSMSYKASPIQLKNEDESVVEERERGQWTVIENRAELLSASTKERWAFNGNKTRYDEEGRAHGTILAAYDGTNTYGYFQKDKRGTISTGKAYPLGAEVTLSWLTGMTDRGQVISETLKTPGWRYEGKQTIGGIECLKLSLREEEGRSEMWLSPKYGYRIVRTTYASTRPSGWNLLSITDIQGFKKYGSDYFPTKGINLHYRTRSGHRELMQTISWSTESYVDRAPNDIFKIKFPAGTKIDDFTKSVRVAPKK